MDSTKTAIATPNAKHNQAQSDKAQQSLKDFYIAQLLNPETSILSAHILYDD